MSEETEQVPFGNFDKNKISTSCNKVPSDTETSCDNGL